MAGILFTNILCCGENVIQLLVIPVHIMENQSSKLIVIVKEMFYVCHLPTFMQSFSKNMHSMVNFCTYKPGLLITK